MIYVGYLLAAMWSLSILVFAVAGAKRFFDEEGILWTALVSGIAIPITLFLAGVPWLFFVQNNSPDLATLKKAEWHCSETRRIGKTFQCVAYERG